MNACRTQKVFMKKTFLLAILPLMMVITAFSPLRGLDEVISAIKAGNANELSKYIDDNIEIALPFKADTYSKAQGTLVLQDFFTNNGVKNFELKHKGDNAGNQFCIGTLITRSGSYRTTVFMTTKNGKQLIREIRFQST
jgi:hypothetical protein